ncbi:MAG: amidase [Rhodoferax sp.]|uniref:amidase n=1 Tax=Rhodoferax sp. TaxID=50421 RepID=UPI00180C715C|nr:amidase [Rhodoferax sp.]NMM18687.1 amidase [Rhodoferax sp.]
MSIVELSAHALSRAIHGGQVSCREVMQAYLHRIEAVNPRHQAIVSLQSGDLLLRQADERDAQLARGASMGWMHGMPQAIKDLANATGIPTTLGSPLMRHFVPQEDGLMVQRMKAAGCIVVGKTNTPEFGLGSHTFNDVFGTTRNAYDATRSAGGSSGGAAVALALRLLPVADGSDFMGSLRNPAGWNNVFGMRPSQGRVPMWPVQDAWVNQLGTEGPMGRTVQDVAQLLAVQAGFDPRAPLSIADGEDFTGALAGFDCKNSRIGWLGDLSGYLAMEPGILDVCEQGLRRLESLGCAVAPLALGTPAEPIWQTWLVWRKALVAARIAPFLLNPKNRAQIKPEALWEYEQARNLTGTEFLRASVQRTSFYQHMLSLFETHDFLALPVAQVWPFAAEQRWPRHINGVEMDTYHRWMEVVIYATLAGLPCISVPVGFDARGLPMGLQLIGRPHGDWALLQLAYAYEQAAQDVLTRQPPAV